jgi:hypothetical protein
VATFAGGYDSIALFSRLASRFTRVRTSRIRGLRGRASAIGALLALVVFIAARSDTGAQSVDGSATWSDAPSVQAAPLIRSFVLRRVADEARSQRRPAPRVESWLAVDASAADRLVRAIIAAPSAVIATPVAGFSVRGYDATAPPYSCA